MPRITKITLSKRAANQWRIFIDGRLALVCAAKVAERMGLRPDLELTPRQVADVQKRNRLQKCYQAATGFLARRMHGKTELQNKLLRIFPADLVEPVVAELSGLGYLNDLDFAKARAEELIGRRMMAPPAVWEDLNSRGIEPGVAEQAIEQMNSANPTPDVARQFAAKKIKQLNDLDRDVARRRLGSTLLRHGFDEELVREILEENYGKSQGDMEHGT